LRIYFLGTGGAGGPPNRARNCFLVESRNARLLLDIGEGCSWRLTRLGLGLCDIDLIYISHQHPDHWSGLHDLMVRGLINGCKKVTIASQVEVLGNLEGLISSYAPIEFKSSIKFLGLENEYTFKGLVIRTVKSYHTVPTYGVTISYDGVVVYYTADTRLGPNILNALSNADLVIHEATLPDGLEELAYDKGHATVSQAIMQSKHMKEGSILAITHLSIESEKQLLSSKNHLHPRNGVNIVVPYDLTLISL